MNRLVEKERERERERGSRTRATVARRLSAQFFIPPSSRHLIWNFASNLLLDYKEASNYFLHGPTTCELSYKRPLDGVYKINVDRATLIYGRKSSLGVIIRDSKSEVATGLCKSLPATIWFWRLKLWFGKLESCQRRKWNFNMLSSSQIHSQLFKTFYQRKLVGKSAILSKEILVFQISSIAGRSYT